MDGDERPDKVVPEARGLVALDDEKRSEALRRLVALRASDDGVPAARLARQVGLAVRTVQRWVAQYRTQGLTGLVRKERSDAGRRRLPADQVALIEGLALRRPQPSVATIHRQVGAVAHERGWPVPSYARVYAIVRTLDPALLTLAHEGTKAYGEAFDLVVRREASRPNEVWQADHTPLDLWVRDDKGRPVRPWLTIVLDDYSRAVAGYALNVQPPSALQTALALRQAIWRKSEPPGSAGWTVCGIPRGYLPHVLWTTTDEIAARGPLDACWRNATGRGAPLARALTALPRHPEAPLPSAYETGEPPRLSALERRLVALSQALPHGTGDATYAALREIGGHPLLTRDEIATSLELTPRTTAHVLGLTCRDEPPDGSLLHAIWGDAGGARATRLYTLLPRGTALLALASGLEVASCRRVYGLYDGGVAHGNEGRPAVVVLGKHSRLVDRIYLAFRAAAVARGETLWWTGEWRQPLLYEVEDEHGRRVIGKMRPDAHLHIVGPHATYRYRIEADRGTERDPVIRDKYLAYAEYGASTNTRQDVLFVTTAPARVAQLRRMFADAARELAVFAPRIYVTTIDQLTDVGPWTAIWDAGDGPCALRPEEDSW